MRLDTELCQSNSKICTSLLESEDFNEVTLELDRQLLSIRQTEKATEQQKVRHTHSYIPLPNVLIFFKESTTIPGFYNPEVKSLFKTFWEN